MNKTVRNIAVYLPQFYETEYNNEWWGKGFTDWVTVKKLCHCLIIMFSLKYLVIITIMIQQT